MVDGEPVPGANEEYFVYQTLVGAWPIDADRMAAYVAKAMHEAKVSTSWITPNARYDEAMDLFVRTIVDPRRSREFLRDFAAFHARVTHFGSLNSLAQLVIKITAPGVPDFYQGTELWDLSLVDPDNRRPVDFAARRQLLEALLKEIDDASDLAGLARQLAKNPHDGRVKLYVTHQGLAFRRRCAGLFLRGDYLPVEATGPFAEHLFAFARVHESAAALVVVPRVLGRRGVEELPIGELYWADTRLTVPPRMAGRFRDVFTGRHVETEKASGTVLAGDVLGDFPVAVLERET
jgi:(1->4)-alpha-D-glucan 1-alpha-D-glucosylmutase